MRYLYLLLLVLGAQAARGQMAADTTAMTATDTLVAAAPSSGVQTATWRVSSLTDSTGLCTEMLSWGQASGLVRIYYGSGLLKEYLPYADLGTGRIHGLVTTWYENGQLESQQPFLRGKREGQLVLYYESGQLKRLSDYVAGAEMLGRCFDATGVAVPYFPYEQPALYPGGQMQLAKEISSAIRLPHEVSMFLGKEECTVYISFLIDEQGSIRNPQVAASSHIPALDRAALATIGKLKYRFAPARRDGLVVQSKYSIPVWFDGMPSLGQPKKFRYP